MNIYDFDPDKVGLLDGYHLVKKAVPGTDLRDLEACQLVLVDILEQMTFDTWSNVGTPHAPWWLKLTKKTNLKSNFKFEHMINSYALNILAPSGVIFKTMQRTDIVSRFAVDDKSYYGFADGLIVKAVPSLDERFLKNYPLANKIDGLDYFDADEVSS